MPMNCNPWYHHEMRLFMNAACPIRGYLAGDRGEQCGICYAAGQSPLTRRPD